MIDFQMAANILKAELKRKNITYNLLKSKLEEIGVMETTNALKAKIARGKFSLVFFLQCMKAIGFNEIKLDLNQ